VPAKRYECPSLLKNETGVFFILLKKLISFLLQRYVGKINLMENKNSVTSRLRYGDRQPIPYSVEFPLQNPLPLLTRLEVNDETICSDSQGTISTPI